ncbi:hypothetical protein ACH41E_04690 [Streptomyces sp. NPDC020412]|uniref:hypothetical protein n=1 Tax=Streptomyces sp. NPDC020412 TaxID=3365073 RepID=UPI0037982DEC
MEAELMALAAAGATALVQQMVAESWVQARDRLVSFFSRGGAEGDEGGQTQDAGTAQDAELIEGELETSRGALSLAVQAGDEQTAADVEAQWRDRLRHALAADPTAAAELRAVLAEFAPEAARGPRQEVHNTISGGVQHGPVVQVAGDLGSLTFGAPPAQRRD